MRKPPRRRKDRFSGRARLWSSGGAGTAAARQSPLPPSSFPRPLVRGEAGEGRTLAPRGAALRRGRAHPPVRARGARAGGVLVAGAAGARRGARGPHRARSPGESERRAPARTPDTQLYYIAPSRASLLAGHSHSFPTSPAQDFLPQLVSRARSIGTWQGGGPRRRAHRTASSSSSLATSREHSCQQPAAPARSLSRRRRRPLLSAFLVSWPIRLLGGVVGLGKHICALNPLPFLLFFLFVFLFVVSVETPFRGPLPGSPLEASFTWRRRKALATGYPLFLCPPFLLLVCVHFFPQ